MLNDCLVSIIVPIYGVEKFIVDNIHSLMDINRDDAECIIINDCTKDTSRDLVAKELLSYTGPVSFRIIDHNQNLGLSEARNSGLKHAKGKWIFFLDGDDYLLTDNFLSVFDDLDKHEDCQIVQTTFKSDWRTCTVHYPSFMLDSKKAQEYYLHGQLVPYAWGRFVKRDFVLKNDLYFVKDIVGKEDIIWLLDILYASANVFFYALPTIFYRENKDSILHNQIYSQKRFDGITCLLEHAVMLGKTMDKKSMSFLLIEHSIPNAFDQLLCHVSDKTSNDRFSAVIDVINERYSNYMTLYQKIVWWHIYTPLRRSLKLTWYRNRLYSFFIRVKRIDT